tara:strand:+ start:171 stop:464 length:294 start_codon:yes stop_codon:yes gene_type:complete
MITQDKAYQIISEINDVAHRDASSEWELADALEEEGKSEEAEDQRDLASEEQQDCFNDEFYKLTQDTQDAIMHYARTDEDFGEEFVQWSGIDIGVEE